LAFAAVALAILLTPTTTATTPTATVTAARTALLIALDRSTFFASPFRAQGFNSFAGSCLRVC
jgi:hypothetical protein